MKIKSVLTVVGLLLSPLGAGLPLQAQLFTVLHNFTNSPDGANPGGVVLSGGTLYGAAAHGGTTGNGMVFMVNTNGTVFNLVYNFSGSATNGSVPNDVILAGNTLFGTTFLGGSNNVGTVFKVDTNTANYKTLHNFTNTPDGANPQARLVLGGTVLFGTTLNGGSNGLGTVFRVDTNGANYSILHHFTNSPDGANPYAGLVLGGATLYGTTVSGGSNGFGTVFKLNTNGTGYTVLYNFTNLPNGQNPRGDMALNNDTLFGTTSGGGSNNWGTVFTVNTNGTKYAVLHSFSGPSPISSSDGAFPKAGVTLNGGMLYGTTIDGGTGGSGTVYQISTNGTGFAVLKNFTNAPDGVNPQGDLALVGSTVYGMTYYGGSGGGFGPGTVFSLLLAPVFTLQPQSLTVTNGNPVTFNAAALGVGTLNYQWYFNTNTAIIGSTNTTLFYANANTNLAGKYLAVATNFYGNTTSSIAALTVVTTPNLFGYSFNPSNGSFFLSMANVSKSTNRLWTATNLAPPAVWRVLQTNIMATNGLWFYTDTNTAKTNSIRFYRLSAP